MVFSLVKISFAHESLIPSLALYHFFSPNCSFRIYLNLSTYIGTRRSLNWWIITPFVPIINLRLDLASEIFNLLKIETSD